MSADVAKMNARSARHPLDAMIVSTDHDFVLLENDAVRMLDTRLAPGDRTQIHAHEWPAALYVLSWSDFLRRDPDGAVLFDSRAHPTRPLPGTALWAPPLIPHYVENVGDNELRIVAVEVKGAAA